MDEVLEVVGDREACATDLTTDQIGAVLQKGLNGRFLAAGFKWFHRGKIWNTKKTKLKS